MNGPWNPPLDECWCTSGGTGVGRSVRIHRNHAVNVHHVLEIRRRSGEADWEIKLGTPVNEVLPVGRTYLKQLWAAFGER